MMDKYKIITITRQANSQLAQADGGSVILAAEGEEWYLDGDFNTDSSNTTAIAARSLGIMQALAYLTPVFNPGSEKVTGDVKLSINPADKFPWVFEEVNSVFTITAKPASIPEDVTVPPGCRVFLVWEGTTVKWAFGPACGSAANALWQLAKVTDEDPSPLKTDQYKISTITKQLNNQLSQGEGGSVVLTADGEEWYLEPIFTTEGGDTRAIVAPSLGMLQVLAYLTPVFNPGSEEVTGEVRLSIDEADKFPWVFDKSDSVSTITARPASIPEGVTVPAGCRVLLVWEGTTVKWAFGPADESPANAIWQLAKVTDEMPPPSQTDQYKISTITRQLNNQLAQTDQGSVVLAVEGEKWYLNPIATTEGGDTRAIVAPSLGTLQALAYLTPVFNPGSAEVTGDVRLSTSAADMFPWVFEEANSIFTITARPASIPEDVTLPDGNQVFLAWEGTTVKWVSSSADESAANSLWQLAKVESAK